MASHALNVWRGDAVGLQGSVMDNFRKLESVFRDTFNLDETIDPSGLRFGSEPPWDSVGHAMLIVALEDAFDIAFNINEAPDLVDVPIIVAALDRHGVSIALPAAG
jgi:acyl carrier protein